MFLCRCLKRQVERTPDAVALSMGQETLRYSELNARANQLARYLRTLDVRPGVVVGICLERSLEMVIALMAVLKAGGTYVPLDPEYPRDRLRFMAEDAAVAIVLTSEGLSDRFDSRACRMLCLDREQKTDCTGGRPQSSADRDISRPGVYPLHVGIDRAAQGSGNSSPGAGELLVFDAAGAGMFRSGCDGLRDDAVLRYRRVGIVCAIAGGGPCRDRQSSCCDGRMEIAGTL